MSNTQRVITIGTQGITIQDLYYSVSSNLKLMTFSNENETPQPLSEGVGVAQRDPDKVYSQKSQSVCQSCGFGKNVQNFKEGYCVACGFRLDNFCDLGLDLRLPEKHGWKEIKPNGDIVLHYSDGTIEECPIHWTDEEIDKIKRFKNPTAPYTLANARLHHEELLRKGILKPKEKFFRNIFRTTKKEVK